MYATLASLKAALNIATTADDALLTDLIVRASRIIDRLTGTTFQATTATRKIWSPIIARDDIRQYVLLLPPGWLLAAAPTAVSDGAGNVIPPADVIPQPAQAPHHSLALAGGARWREREGAITITGAWGYSLTPPDDIVHATIRLAAWLYRQRDTHQEVMYVQTLEGGVVVPPARLPLDVTALTNHYRSVIGAIA